MLQDETKKTEAVATQEMLHPDIRKDAFIHAWIRSFGNVTQSCMAIGISRMTYYRWLKEDDLFSRALESEDVRERYKDFLESKLVERINDKSDAALIFALKTQAKDRGYIEKADEAFTEVEIIVTERLLEAKTDETEDSS